MKRAVKDYLNATGWFNFHVLQGMGAYKGVPDRIAIKNGIVLFIEVKQPKGKQSDNQIGFEKDIWQAGGHYILVKCIDDLIEAIKIIE